MELTDSRLRTFLMFSLKLLLLLVAQGSNLEEPNLGNRRAVDNRQWILLSQIAHASTEAFYCEGYKNAKFYSSMIV